MVSVFNSLGFLITSRTSSLTVEFFPRNHLFRGTFVEDDSRSCRVEEIWRLQLGTLVLEYRFQGLLEDNLKGFSRKVRVEEI